MSSANDEARMTNDEGMTKPEVRPARLLAIRPLLLATLLGCAWLLFSPTAFAVETLEEMVEQRFDVDADIAMSVQNIDGSVRVYAHEHPVVIVQAIKKAYSAERLHGIVVDTKASPKSIVITTSFPPRKNALSDRSGTVDYVIVVPQTAKITQLELTNGEVLVEGLRNGGSAKAHLVNGWMIGHNCFGDLDLKVETGRLDVAYDWWENHDFAIKALTIRGGLRAIFPSDASLNLSATATEGRIANGFGSKKTGSGDIIHSIAEVIGTEPRAAISLESRRDNIRIEKMNY
jgi:hypothetical protein